MVKVGDVKYNVEQIENLTVQAEGKGVEVIVFPELSVTGYSCQDLFSQNLLLEVAEQGVMMLLDFTRKLDIITIVGAPVVAGDLLLNCAVVIQQGQILGIRAAAQFRKVLQQKFGCSVRSCLRAKPFSVAQQHLRPLVWTASQAMATKYRR